VIVVSKGDEALLELGDERKGWHFPQNEDGVYAGHYPASSAEAVAHLEELRSKGASFLLFPETSLWWLDHYQGIRDHLESRYRLLVHEEGTCLIFDLGEFSETVDPNSPARASGARSANDRTTPAP
jgi:hypothetical protein